MAEHRSGGSTQAKNTSAASHAPVAHEPPKHGPVQLGPIDWPAWLAGAIGIVAGLLVVGAFYLGGRG